MEQTEIIEHYTKVLLDSYDYPTMIFSCHVDDVEIVKTVCRQYNLEVTFGKRLYHLVSFPVYFGFTTKGLLDELGI